MLCKVNLAALRDWLDAWLKVHYPEQRFYIGGRDEGDGLSYTLHGGVIDIPVKFITTDLVDITVAVVPSLGDDFPNEQAAQHAQALRTALHNRWRGVSAIPDEPPPGAPLDDWFSWRRTCEAIGVRVTLAHIADRTGYTAGWVRQRHALWNAENE